MTESQNSLKMCVILKPPADKISEAVSIAIKERAGNAGSLELEADALENVTSRNEVSPEMAVMVRKLWRNGRTLRVRFLDGEPAIQAKVVRWPRNGKIMKILSLISAITGRRRSGLPFATKGKPTRPYKLPGFLGRSGEILQFFRIKSFRYGFRSFINKSSNFTRAFLQTTTHPLFNNSYTAMSGKRIPGLK